MGTVLDVLMFLGVWALIALVASIPVGAMFWEGAEREAPAPDDDYERCV
jgi:hypothetical protein